MLAAVFDTPGEPADVLTARDIPEPTPGRGEVRVRMLASPVNPSDLMTIRGQYGHQPPLPAVPGYEGVGIVESGGGLLGRLLRGKRVAVLNKTGGNWAEFTVLPAKQCVPLPKSLPIEQAAMFFVNPVTAVVMTRKVLAVPKGAWLAQSAAGSSLGRMVIALGRHDGFKTLCVVRRAEQADELRGLGADAVAVFDGDTDNPADLTAKLLELTGGSGVRYAIDPVGGSTAAGLTGALRGGGRLLCYGTLSGKSACISPRDLLTHGTRMEGFWLSRWMEFAGLPRRLTTVRAVSGLLTSGVLRNDVGQSFRLPEIRDAVRHSEAKARGGKAWLRIGGD